MTEEPQPDSQSWNAAQEDRAIAESAHRIVGPSFEEVQPHDVYADFIAQHPAEAAVWMRDMVARNQESIEARKVAETHDQLTGLLNRTGFRDQIERVTAHHDRGSDQNLQHVIIFGDVDEFGSLNSGHGNLFGDKIIVDVADSLFHGVRTEEGDVVARVGGEEFAIFLHDIAVSDVETVLKRVRQAVNGINYLDDDVDIDGIGITFGVVPFRQGEDLDTALDRANVAESASKYRHPQKNSTVYWSEADDAQIRDDAKKYGEKKFARGKTS
jgi:diguanylate cyclase (GGDEF)-like protein